MSAVGLRWRCASPPMNFLPGSVADGYFRASEIKVPSTTPFQGDAVLGIRAEDAFVNHAGAGPVRGEIYAVEPTGEPTLIIVKTADAMVAIRESKSYRLGVGEPVSVVIRPGLEMIFDKVTERRVA